MTEELEQGSVRALLDYLIVEFRLRNPSHLALEMKVTTSTMSKLMNAKQPLAVHHILHIHEYFGVPVWEIRERSGQYDLPRKKKSRRPGRLRTATTEVTMIPHKKAGLNP